MADKVKLPPSKLDVLFSAIEVSPLDIVAPMSDKPHVEDTTVETEVVTQEKIMDTIDNIPVVEGEGEKETENKESSDSTSYSWTEDEYDEELRKKREVEEQLGEQVRDSAEEEKEIEGEGDSESKGDEDEKKSESEGTDPESKEENTSGESEGSMAIGNIVIAHLEEVSGEERPSLTSSAGDEEVDSDKDDLPLSEVGKKGRKAPVRSTKLVPQERKEVDPRVRTPLTRSKRKVVDEQMIKEFRGPKKTRQLTPVTEPLVKSDEEDESGPSLWSKKPPVKGLLLNTPGQLPPLRRPAKKRKKGLYLM
ncbi:uncharacterized protein [Nicotiana tomentosiformis]|uniref:uncharacterized protein n=1 Tax=Nicotiana tomentosiformis TaxID=4098 RepID=UPI00051B29D3|nr:nucleolar and coiled-body phosphoprotein 1-like [Nicotiana tomentosiformis]